MTTPNPAAENLATLRGIVARLNLSAGALGILGAAIDARIRGVDFTPDLEPHLKGVVTALGAGGLLESVPPETLRPILAEIRLTLLDSRHLSLNATRQAGWDSTDPDVLRAAGEISVGFIVPLSEQIVPRLAGLGDRLAAGGAFLDVGVGVGALAIAVALKWPAVRVVGLDPWGPSIELARENVRTAGLGDRITLRQIPAEELNAQGVFDLAWVPTPFIPPAAIPAILRAAHAALRPGAWLLVAKVNPGDDELAGAFGRARTALWGGGVWTTSEIETQLRDLGFADVAALPAPPGSPAAMIAGRRSE